MRRSFIATAIAGLLALSTGVHAQESGVPIRILVGFAPGGALDTVARAVAERLRVTLNQPVIVDNKPGAGQRLALGELKRAKADGLTLMLSNNSPFTIFPHIYKKLEFDPVKDFTPIGRVATYDLCIAAGPKAPAGGMKEFMTWAKANPQEAAYGTSGAGNMGHFVGDMVSKATNTALIHIPYKGGAPAMTDLVGGQIPIVADTILESMEMAKGGKVRILATTGATRASILPDVPTLTESGINVVVEAYVGLYGPPGMPADTVQRLSKALGEAMQSPDLQKRIVQFAMVPAYSKPTELVRFQAEALARWEAPIKASGFTAD